MKRCFLVCVALVALVAASCTGKGGSVNASGTTTTAAASSSGDTTATSKTGPQKFGTLDSPCGKAPSGTTVSIAKADAGKGTDKLYLGVANERTNQIPGTANLLKEMWDTSVAFAKWCNDQGGIDGVQVSLVDLDAKVTNVPGAMATACTDTFALVGGGWAQDNLAFSGQTGTDFYKCKMIAFPGFAVSTQFAGASGVVQAVPNPPYDRSVTWLENLVKLYPDKMSKVVGVYANVPSLKINMDQITSAKVKGMNFVGQPISYNAVGSNDWNGLAEQIISSGAKAVSLVGQPGGMSALSQALKGQNWDGLLFADSNEYSPDLINDAGPAAVEGNVVRIAYHPFEEADKWPAVKQYVDIMNTDGPADPTIALLGQQSWSAWLLFATSAKSCIEGSGNGQLSRDCVRQAASQVHDWTGGGLHAATDPGKGTPTKCSMLVTVKDGKWTRLFPKLKSADDTQDGFSCLGLQKVQGDFGTATTDPGYKSY
jgi:ABC-type branched-subunit amino acid transport system substrate-binding protein